jgi:hypothetical protein
MLEIRKVENGYLVHKGNYNREMPQTWVAENIEYLLALIKDILEPKEKDIE